MNFLSQIQAGTKLSETPAPAPAPPKPKYPVVGAESIMAPKAHGTAERPVQTDLRWGCDRGVADRICGRLLVGPGGGAGGGTASGPEAGSAASSEAASLATRWGCPRPLLALTSSECRCSDAAGCPCEAERCMQRQNNDDRSWPRSGMKGAYGSGRGWNAARED